MARTIPTDDWLRAAENATSVAQEIVGAGSVVMEADRVDHHIVATAALLRCRALLLATVALVHAERWDLIGLPGRSLFESWIYGTIALHGDEGDLQRLASDTQRRRTSLRQRLGEHTVLNPADKTLTERKRFERASELLRKRDDHEAGQMDAWYDLYYGGDSLLVAHTNLDSLDRYIVAEADGDIEGFNADPPSDGADFGRLVISTVLTALLAKELWAQTGRDPAVFDDLVEDFVPPGDASSD